MLPLSFTGGIQMNTKMRRWTIIGIDTFFVIGFLTVMVLPFGVIGHTIRTI